VATYSTVDDIDGHHICKQYGLDLLSLEPLDGGAANSSFKATTGQGPFVLTVLDNHDAASAHRLAVHTDAMFRLGMPTAEVVRNLTGQMVTAVGDRLVMLKRWIPGQVLDRLPDDLLPTAGELLAELHRLPPAQVPDLPVGTRRLSSEHHAAITTFPDQEFARWLTERLADVHDREADLADGGQVISHGDVFSDNLIVRPDRRLAIIDWETISLDSPLLDLGMTVLGLAKDDGRLSPHRANLIVKGYVVTRPLSAEELRTLAVHIEHAALIIAFHRYYRHNIRFPDPAKRHLHAELIGFVDSLGGFRPATGQDAGTSPT
jgi:homoserine kinase type II